MRANRLSAVSLVGLTLTAVLYVVGNLWLDTAFRGSRLDLTEHKLFTLSAGTHATLATIDEPIELHLFFSKRLAREVPFYATYARRVRELLDEIVDAGTGKVVLHIHDPEPFSVAEDRAVAMGVQGIPLDQGGELAYFGLAGINTVDEVEVQPFFQPDRESLLEYDLVALIHRLTVATPTVLGVISSLPILGDMRARLEGKPSPQWAIAEHLTRGFEVINLPQSFDELPANLDVLMIVHPRELGARELYVIEQFLFRGGRAFVLLDPKSEAPSAVTAVGPNAASSSATGLEPLLSHWGIAVPDGRLAGDRLLAWRVNAGTSQRVIPTDYVVWLTVPGQHMSQDDPATAHVSTVNLASAGYLVRDPNSPLTLEPLISTSVQSAPVPVEAVAGLRPDIISLHERFTPDPHIYVLAARVSGEMTSAFLQGPPPRTIPRTLEESAKALEPEQRLRSDGPIRLILVADTDLLQDRLWTQKQRFFGREVSRPIAGNATFVANALGVLGGSDALIALRSRGVSRRSFERIDALRERAEVALRQQEQTLQEKLQATKDKIDSLEGVRSKPNPQTGEVEVEIQLSPAQRTEVETLRRDMLSTRGELRDVQRGLQEDVESLKAKVQFVNIAAMPLLVAALAGALSAARVARRRRRAADS